MGLGETEMSLLEGIHNVLCTPEPKGKQQWPHKRLNQAYLLILEGLLQRQGVAEAHLGDKDSGSSGFGKCSFVWALPETAINSAQQSVGSRAGKPQAKQPTEWQQPRPLAERLLEVFLSRALPRDLDPSARAVPAIQNLVTLVSECKAFDPKFLYCALIWGGIQVKTIHPYAKSQSERCLSCGFIFLVNTYTLSQDYLWINYVIIIICFWRANHGDCLL